MKSVRPVIASNGVLYIQMTSVGSYRRSGREMEGRRRLTLLPLQERDDHLRICEGDAF